MSTIAIVPSLLTGRINASFEFATRLIAEGHTIIYLCPSYSIEKIKANGFSTILLPYIAFNYENPLKGNRAYSWMDKLKFHLKYYNKHYAQGKEILNLEGHKAKIVAVNPDLILIDNELHELIFTAWDLKIPVKLITTWFSDKISLKTPSIRTSIIPGKRFSGSKVGIGISWFKMRLKIRGRILLNILTFQNYRRWMIKTYAQNIGFNTNELLPNTLPPLYSFKKLPIISFSMLELDFPNSGLDNITHVGPMIYENRIDKTEISSLAETFKKIIDDKNNTNKKLIYCSVGSYAKGSISFMKNVIEAVSKHENWILIVSIGPSMNKEDFINAPKNVFIYNWVSQIDILKEADCGITHCGLNSINECIHYSVPMLLYSGKYTEQDGNAARMAYHGLGVRGDIYRDSMEDIESNLKEIFSNQKYQKNINKFNEIYNSYSSKPLTPILFDEQT